MTTDLNALAERVEKLSGPDREVDALICATMHKVLVYPPDALEGRNGPLVYVSPHQFGPQWLDIPSYTASLDAAMTLVPEGLHIAVGQQSGWPKENKCFAQVGAQNDHIWTAATPILALCTAALKHLARASEAQPKGSK